jgi:hypothetical protein
MLKQTGVPHMGTSLEIALLQVAYVPTAWHGVAPVRLRRRTLSGLVTVEPATGLILPSSQLCWPQTGRQTMKGLTASQPQKYFLKRVR